MLVCAVAALVVLAGCGAGPLDGADAAYTTSGEELNGTELRSDHVAGLESADSFTTVVDVSIESGDRDARLNQTTAVNLTGDRARQSSSISAGGTVGELGTDSYTEGDVTFERLSLGSGDDATVQYRRGSGTGGDAEPVNVTDAMHADLAEEIAESVDWTQTGVVDRDGETLTRYDATGRENFSDFRNETALGDLGELDTNATDATVTAVNATLLVGPDGVVREFRFEFAGTADGRSVAMRFTVRTTGIGTTDAAPPDWLDEARDRTGG